MKPMTNMYGCVATTAAFLILCGFMASKIPVSTASESAGGMVVDANEPDAVRSTTGLLVDITNVRNGNGKVVVFVFDDERAFEEYDYERAVAYTEIAAASGRLQAQFSELRAGPYAVSLFHDENDDDDFNMDGVYPLEGYGTSGAGDQYDEPTFEQASSDSGRISVHMYYLQ